MATSFCMATSLLDFVQLFQILFFVKNGSIHQQEMPYASAIKKHERQIKRRKEAIEFGRFRCPGCQYPFIDKFHLGKHSKSCTRAVVASITETVEALPIIQTVEDLPVAEVAIEAVKEPLLATEILDTATHNQEIAGVIEVDVAPAWHDAAASEEVVQKNSEESDGRKTRWIRNLRNSACCG